MLREVRGTFIRIPKLSKAIPARTADKRAKATVQKELKDKETDPRNPDRASKKTDPKLLKKILKLSETKSNKEIAKKVGLTQTKVTTLVYYHKTRVNKLKEAHNQIQNGKSTN